MSKPVDQEIIWLDVTSLAPAPWNINEMDDETFTALFDDMKQQDGPNRVNPIRVRPIDGGYQLIDGHQRLRAAQKLGWKKVRGMIVACSELDARLWNFRMNHERGNINPVREAEFFQQMVNRGWSLRKIEKELGIKRQRVQQILRRLRVSSEAADILEKAPSARGAAKSSKAAGEFKLAPQHYEAIGGIKDVKLQKEVAKVAVDHALPAHETRKLVSLVKKGMSVEEGLRLIAGGKVETENVVVFACKKCKTPYHVDWEGREIKPIE